MATKDLTGYKLAVVLDASGAAKGISALGQADKAATKLDSSFEKLGRSAVRGFGDMKKAAADNSQKTQQALAAALRAGQKNVGGLINEAKKAQAEFRALEKAEEKALKLTSGGFLGRMSARSGSIIPGLSQISNVIQGIPQIGQLAHSLVSPLMEIAETGLEFNMLVEEAQIGFEGITGGAKEAGIYVRQLTDFAAENPIFNTQGTINAARTMAVFGFETKKTTDYLKAWGSALAGGGKFNDDNLQSVVTAFGQMRAKGKVSAEEMMQLAERGIPAWELLAKAIGKTTAETMKLAEQGRLKGGAAVDAITAMLGTDPRFAGQADKYAHSLRGRLAQAQDLKEVAAGQSMRGTAVELRNSLEFLMTGSVPALIGKMSEGMDTALTPVAKVISASVKGTVGGGITSGLAEGIDATKGIVIDATKNLGLMTLFTLKDVLDSHSPSEEMRKIGRDAGTGYALGLRDAMKQLAKEHGGDLRKYLEDLAQDPRFKAWFETIRQVEGGRPNVMAGGRVVNSGPRHPGQIVPRSEWFRGPKGASSAAGNWQTTLSNWKVIAPILGLDNFSDVDQQMMAALVLFAAEGGDKALLSGNMKGALKASRPWAATPLSHLPGRKPLDSAQFLSRYNQVLTGSVPSRSRANAVPVTIVGVEGGAESLGEELVKRDEYSPEFGGVASIARTKEEWATLDKQRAQIKGIFDSVTTADEELTQRAENMLPEASRALPPGYAMGLIEENARRASEGLKVAAAAGVDYAKLVIGAGETMSQRLGTAFSNLGAFIPGQQVGKKRGFFSKLLGAAAPFLSFIPGVGGVLSTLANIGSSAVGGDYAGAFTQGVAGFKAGGAFRSTPKKVDGAKAVGGPVSRGRAYLVGENRAEVFVPNEDGWIHPDANRYSGMAASARSGSMAEMIFRLLDKMEQHTAAVNLHAQATQQLHAKIASMPADHVVTVGARHQGAQTAIADAFMARANRDPKALEWMTRRVNGI